MIGFLFQKYIDGAFTYEGYRNLIDGLLAENKTTGATQTEELVNYTRLNVHRMERLDKTITIVEGLRAQLQTLKRKYIWLVITEGWCGDAAQNIPVLNLIAQQTPNIDLKLVLRDEHPELIDRYLTNGGRAIPKMVILDADTLEELGTWGPRPATAQQMVLEYKKNPTKPYSEFVIDLQLWYAKDRTLSLQQEILALLVVGD